MFKLGANHAVELIAVFGSDPLPVRRVHNYHTSFGKEFKIAEVIHS